MRTIEKWWKYLSYLFQHILWVWYYAYQLGVPASRYLRHDLSKFSRAELSQYANYFDAKRHGDITPEIKEAFEAAWVAHYTVNDHHWNHWVVNGVALDMPDVCVREMMADWKSAHKMQGGHNLRAWYEADAGYEKFNISENTRAKIEALLP